MLQKSPYVPFFFALVIVVGCRTYGREYAATEATNQQLRRVAEQLESSAVRAADDHRRLSGVQGIDQSLVAEYGDIVVEHNAAADELAASFDADLGYRSASRMLGAAVSASQAFHNRYQAVLREIVSDSSVAAPDRTARYGTVPASYYASEMPISVDDVIRRVGSDN